MVSAGSMSASCETNPDFCNFNRVYMPYCDGASFSGDREEAVVVHGTEVCVYSEPGEPCDD